MTSPVDPLPPRAVGPSSPGTPPAASTELPPVWDVTGARWVWNPETANYDCEDPGYHGPSVTSPGAIPRDRQPHYAHPPSETDQLAAELYDENGELR